MTDAPQKSEWVKPQAIFGALNFIWLIAVAIVTVSLYVNNSDAKIADRVTRLEGKVEYRVLPALERIEKKLDAK